MFRFIQMFMMLLLAASVLGCSTYPVRPIPQMTALGAPAQNSVGSVRVGAKPYTDARDSKAIFNYDLPGKGVLPMLVVIENSSGSELEVLRQRIEFQAPDGHRLEPIAPDAATAGHGRNAMAEAILLFGIFSYDNATKYNQDMRRDWADKGFPEVELIPPGGVVTRFLYFDVGKQFSLPGCTLTVPMSPAGSGQRDVAVLQF